MTGNPGFTAGQRACRALFLRTMSGLHRDRIVLRDGLGVVTLGAGEGAELQAEVEILDPAFYPAAVLEQSAGVGRAFMAGWWRCGDLVTLIRIFSRHEEVLRRWTRAAMTVLAPWQRLALWSRRNSPDGSRRNISEHYDLGEEFFETFLDPSLTYSCAYFTDGASDLEGAQREKLDRACRKLALQPDDHLLEIGTGWGSLALHAAREYGCRVTSTTISREQARYARQRVAEAGLGDRIEIVERDYRDLRGRFDKLISIEMIEAVGVKFYPVYFRRCSELLKDDGAMLLQAITVDDRHFEHDAKHEDFIKRYIFPGGVLPSIQVIARQVAQATDLQIAHLEDLTAHYAETLRLWRERLLAAADRIRALGRDDIFLRCWEFYFAYCEGGFRERRIGDVQVLLVKPGVGPLAPLRLPGEESWR